MNRLSGKKIVVVRTGALGDVLMILPFLQALQSVQPQCLHVVVEARQKDLMQGFDCVDQAFAADDLQWWQVYGDSAEAPPYRFLQNYDCVVAFIQDHGGTVSDRLRQRLSAEVHVRPPFPYRNGLHVSEYYLQTFAEPRPQPAWPPVWQAPESSRHAAERTMASLKNAANGCWVLHPGSGGISKNWPLSAFGQQAEWLQQQGVAPVFLLGPAEVTMAEAVHALAGERAIPVWDNFPLTDCAALLNCCDGFLGNDAGIAHLAAALGLPTVAVFVNSDPVMWQPLGSNVSVVDIRKEKGAAQPGSKAVQEALSRWVPLRSDP